jgi:hypothetical protein
MGFETQDLHNYIPHQKKNSFKMDIGIRMVDEEFRVVGVMWIVENTKSSGSSIIRPEVWSVVLHVRRRALA